MSYLYFVDVADTNEVPSAPSEGARLYYDNGTLSVKNSDGIVGGIPSLETFRNVETYFNHFRRDSTWADTVLAVGVSGAGAAVTNGASAAAFSGTNIFSTGTTNTGNAYALSHAGAYRFGAGGMSYETRVRVPTISDGTETFTVRLGFFDSVTADATDGAYFELDSNADAQWQCKTANNSSRTTTDSATTCVANTWYVLRIDVNAAGTSVVFKIGTSAANLATVATHTANIPTSRDTGMGLTIVKSAGTTARTLEADYLGYVGRFTYV